MEKTLLNNDDVAVVRLREDYDINRVGFWDAMFRIENKTKHDMNLEFPATDDFNGSGAEPATIMLPAATETELSWGDVGVNWFQAFEKGEYNISKIAPLLITSVYNGGFYNLCVDGKHICILIKEQFPIRSKA